MSFVRWLYGVGLVYLRGAVVSRPKPWTRLRCSESHWSNPVVLPLGQPGAPASSTSLPAWFVSWWTGIGDSAACLLCGWVGVQVWMRYIRLLCILQCTAGLSGTMTSWNVLNSSAVGTFNEPAPTRATLPNVKLVWRNCCLQSCQSSAFFCCPSVESSHCLASCYLHDWRYSCMLFIFASIAYGWGVPLAELNHFAGVHFSPMKLGALHYMICDGCMEVFHWLAKLPMRHYRPPPLLGGYLAQWPPRHSCSRRIYDSDSVHGGPLDKLIWEDAERGIVVAPWSCTASAHICQSRQTKCLGLHVFLNVVVLNSFSHVFESDAVVKPLCPLANLFGGCFCLGSGPFCVSGLLFLLTKRKSGWGICGSSGWSLCCLVCCDLPEFPDPFGPCTNWRFTAYAHVRTEPQCDIGHTRGKKKVSLSFSPISGVASLTFSVATRQCRCW